MNETITFTITPKDVEKYNHTASGKLIDFCAVAIGQYEYDEVYSMNLDYFADNVDHAFNAIDHEMAYIEYLNATKEPKDGLKYGAWYALNDAENFAIDLSEWIDKQREALTECLGDYSHMPEPYKTTLQESFEWDEDNLNHEWLHGDHSSMGLLHELEKNLFGHYAKIEYDKKTDEMDVTIDIADAIEEMSIEHPLTDPEYTRTEYVAYIVNSYAAETEKQKQEAQKRREENKKTREYREAVKAAEEKARIEKLQSMKA